MKKHFAVARFPPLSGAVDHDKGTELRGVTRCLVHDGNPGAGGGACTAVKDVASEAVRLYLKPEGKIAVSLFRSALPSTPRYDDIGANWRAVAALRISLACHGSLQ